VSADTLAGQTEYDKLNLDNGKTAPTPSLLAWSLRRPESLLACLEMDSDVPDGKVSGPPLSITKALQVLGVLLNW
jgi:hypothetical protein